MILFFRTPTKSVIATEVSQELPSEDIQKLSWLYGEVHCRERREPEKVASSDRVGK